MWHMATHIPYHRWILISKSIQSLSAKLHTRNQSTPDRNLSRQTSVIPQWALPTPRAINQPWNLLWLGWRDGICISSAVPSPKPEQGCPHRYAPQGYRAPSVKLLQGTKKALCLQVICHGIFVLLSSTTLQNQGIHRHWALLQERPGAEKRFTYLLLEPLLQIGKVTQQREWEKKIKTRNNLLEHSWGLRGSQAIMVKNTQWWDYRVRENEK